MKSILETMKNIDLSEEIVTIRSAMKDADMDAIQKLVDKMI